MEKTGNMFFDKIRVSNYKHPISAQYRLEGLGSKRAYTVKKNFHSKKQEKSIDKNDNEISV